MRGIEYLGPEVDMRLLLLGCCFCLIPAVGFAQTQAPKTEADADAASAPAASPNIVLAPAPANPPGLADIGTLRLKRAEDRSRRARVGLIASSAIFAAGLGLSIAAATECETVDRGTFERDEIECSDLGVGLVSGAVALSIGGLGGIIASAIMLSRRNRRIRRIEDQMYRRRVHWDVQRNRLVF